MTVAGAFNVVPFVETARPMVGGWLTVSAAVWLVAEPALLFTTTA